MISKCKKLAVVSAMALMFASGAHAVDISSVDAVQGNMTDVTDLIAAQVGTNGVTDAIANIVSGAVNTALVNGAIDITGTNVSFGSVAANVSATATAVGTTASSEAYAIAGAKLSTTVIGAMNSSTLDVMGKLTEQTDAAKVQLGLGSLASSGGTVSMTTTGLDAGQLAGALTSGNVLSLGSTTDASLANLTSETTYNLSNKVSELQAMNVFNSAINVATLDAGIRIAATEATNPWFLNPQTGVVNLSNIAMTTTAIGAMNSSVTRLGANLAK